MGEKSPSSSGRVYRCYYCGEGGHLFATCAKRMAAESLSTAAAAAAVARSVNAAQYYSPGLATPYAFPAVMPAPAPVMQAPQPVMQAPVQQYMPVPIQMAPAPAQVAQPHVASSINAFACSHASSSADLYPTCSCSHVNG